MPAIVQDKVRQAVGILEELEIDAWLTFARETTESGDPVLPLILGHPVTWQSAFIVTRSGERIAIVGKYEDEAVASTGAWSVVTPYVKSIREPLVETLSRLAPERLAVNHSVDDVKADGLTHGMYMLLEDYLAPTGLGDRLIGAGEIIRRLRGRKTPGEVERLRRAIASTDEIFAALVGYARPGADEVSIATFMRAQARERGLGLAWEAAQCPIVTTGPGSMVGHAMPNPDLRVTPGQVLHIDFGVRREEYCSDMQRAWYVPRDGERSAPEAVQRGFDTVVEAITAAGDALRPGVPGWQVDAAARRVITEAGYPEYQHATGHHVGRAAHDGAGVLGPRWERYGRTPEYTCEPGNVFTLELGIDNLDGRGYLGLEEMVLVTDDGIEWLTTPQRTLPLLG
jgi:Xaa-Pro aminopeptidase